MDRREIAFSEEGDIIQTFIHYLEVLNKEKNDFPKREGDITIYEIKFGIAKVEDGIEISPIMVTMQNMISKQEEELLKANIH